MAGALPDPITGLTTVSRVTFSLVDPLNCVQSASVLSIRAGVLAGRHQPRFDQQQRVCDDCGS